MKKYIIAIIISMLISTAALAQIIIIDNGDGTTSTCIKMGSIISCEKD